MMFHIVSLRQLLIDSWKELQKAIFLLLVSGTMLDIALFFCFSLSCHESEKTKNGKQTAFNAVEVPIPQYTSHFDFPFIGF